CRQAEVQEGYVEREGSVGRCAQPHRGRDPTARSEGAVRAGSQRGVRRCSRRPGSSDSRCDGHDDRLEWASEGGLLSDNWLNEPTPALPAPAELPVEPRARLALLEECWQRLTPKQRAFLTAFRENRLNASRTSRALYGHRDGRSAHINWLHERDYGTVVRIWQGAAGQEALDKDRLLARQDDIVETLLTPKPVLHQGLPVFDPKRPGEILEEVEAGGASRANEVLMKAAGLLKDK